MGIELNLVDKSIPSDVYIIDRVFGVRTVREALHTVEYIEKYGTRSTGSKVLDQQLIGSYVYPYLSIAKMANIYSKNYLIALSFPQKDAARAYQYVQYHLESWMAVMNSSPNLVRAPIEDLQKLDALATSVFAVAAGYMEEQQKQTTFAGFLETIAQGAGIEVFEDSANTNTSEVRQKVAPSRYSFQDELLHHQARLMR